MPPTLSGLRDFRLLWIGGLLAGFGAQMTAIALPLLVLRQTGSTVQAGAIGTVSIGALLVTTLPGGALADSIERRRLMRICDVFSLIAVSGLAIAVLAGQAPLVLVLLVAASAAVINSMVMPAALGLLRAVVPEDMLGAASSRMQARGATARLVGPLVGGALFGWQPAAPFVGEAAALLVATTCLALMRTRSTPAKRSAPAFSKRELGAGIIFLWKQRYLRAILLMFGVGMNSAFSAVLFASLAIASRGGHSGLGGGMIVSLAAAGSLVGALVAPRLRPEDHARVLIAGTCWVCAAAVAVLAFVRQPLLIGVVIAVCTALASVASIGFLTTLLRMTPDDKVGRVQSAAGFLSSLAQPLGPLGAGAALGTLGAAATFGLLGGVITLCAVATTWAGAVREGATAVVEQATTPI
jgi:MFS family permease